jgi:hypothetical protein
MRLIIPTLILSCLPLAVLAQTPPAPASSAPRPDQKAPTAKHYSTGDTDIGTLLDNPDSKAVLDKYMPGFSENPQIELARGMTLLGIQPYSSDTLTDDVMKKIDADLAKIAVK